MQGDITFIDSFDKVNNMCYISTNGGATTKNNNVGSSQREIHVYSIPHSSKPFLHIFFCLFHFIVHFKLVAKMRDIKLQKMRET